MKNKQTGAEDRMNQNEKKEMKIRIAKEEDAEALLARDKNFKALQEQMNEDYSFYPMANTNYVMVARKEFKGLDAIKRVPIFEDYTKITMEK